MMYTKSFIPVAAIALAFFFSGCDKEDLASNNAAKAPVSGSTSVPLGTMANFAVLGGTTVTNDGASIIDGDVGVSPGTALTGFLQAPLNSIMGPGTVTAGLGQVNGIIYAGGPIAAQAHNDAVIAYDYLVAQVPDLVYSGVTQLNGMTFTPGVYQFAPSANLQVNGTVYLDFQGNSDAQFIFILGSTLVTMTGSNVVALNNGNSDCNGSNVFWAVGSSATIDGDQFIGTVIANTSISMTYGAAVSGSIIAINGAVTMITNKISLCAGSTTTVKKCDDFVTGGGWILGAVGTNGKQEKATFGVSGGIKHNDYWGNFSYDDHGTPGIKVKSTSVTSYIVIDQFTRKIEGIAKVNGSGNFTYTVIVVDKGEPGTSDSISIKLSNAYVASGILDGGNIQLHAKCN